MQFSVAFVSAVSLLVLISVTCFTSRRSLHDISFVNNAKLPVPSKATTSKPSPLLVEQHQSTDFEYNDLPQWLQAFVDLNRNQTEGPHLRYVCTGAYCGGVADRVKGLIQTFYMSMCTGRKFYVHWKTPVPIRQYFEPNLIHWNSRTTSPSAKTLLSMGKATKELTNPYLLDPNTSYDIKTNKWLGDEEILNSTCIQDYLAKFEDGKDARELFRLAFWTLFRWSPRVIQGVDTIRTQLNVTMPYVAIHMRTGLVPNIKDAKRTKPRKWHFFDKCAKAFQQGIRDKCKGSSVPIYLASDSSLAKEKLMSLDTDGSLKTLSDMEIYHIDRTRASTLSDGEEAMLGVFNDLKLLTDSTCLVMSPSGYSRLAQWLHPQPRCAAYYNDCGSERVAEELAKLDGICDTI